jgi:hypothetical protein
LGEKIKLEGNEVYQMCIMKVEVFKHWFAIVNASAQTGA